MFKIKLDQAKITLGFKLVYYYWTLTNEFLSLGKVSRRITFEKLDNRDFISSLTTIVVLKIIAIVFSFFLTDLIVK